MATETISRDEVSEEITNSPEPEYVRDTAFLESEERNLADSILAQIKHRATAAEQLDTGISISGYNAVLALRTSRLLELAETAPDQVAETDVERLAINDLLESSRRVIAHTLSARSETFQGRSIDFMRKTKFRRIVGKIAVGSVFALGVGLASKGMDHALTGVGAGIGLMGAKGVALKSKLFVGKMISGGANNLKSKVLEKIDEIPVEKMKQIQEAATGLPLEEAEDYINGLIAAEIVSPLKAKLSLIAFEGDLRKDSEHHATSGELAERLAIETTGFLRKLYDVEGAVRQTRLVDTTVKAAREVVSSMVPGTDHMPIEALTNTSLDAVSEALKKK